MKEITVYLAGKMSGLSFNEMNIWRQRVAHDLKERANYSNSNINVINPVLYFNFESKKQQNELEIMKFDLSKVKSSDIVIVNMDGLNTSIGTCIECYEAYKQEIPVLAFGSDDLFKGLHPWIQNCITRHDGTYIETNKYIEDFYLN